MLDLGDTSTQNDATMTESSIPWTRIESLLRAKAKDAAWLKAALGVEKQRFSNWKTRGIPKRSAPQLAEAFEVTTDVIFGIKPVLPVLPISSIDDQLGSTRQSGAETGSITWWDVRGACGGGIFNEEQLPKGHLIKEAGFFRKYGLKPEEAFAIYADGNSMANFIVDGDIVIFNRVRTEPVSGQIFAIEHPDGLRIKRLRRKINGNWLLESDNPDKARYPDEEIDADQAELLKIHGQFVYRQGG